MQEWFFLQVSVFPGDSFFREFALDVHCRSYRLSVA